MIPNSVERSQELEVTEDRFRCFSLLKAFSAQELHDLYGGNPGISKSSLNDQRSPLLHT